MAAGPAPRARQHCAEGRWLCLIARLESATERAKPRKQRRRRACEMQQPGTLPVAPTRSRGAASRCAIQLPGKRRRAVGPAVPAARKSAQTSRARRRNGCEWSPSTLSRHMPQAPSAAAGRKAPPAERRGATEAAQMQAAPVRSQKSVCDKGAMRRWSLRMCEEGCRNVLFALVVHQNKARPCVPTLACAPLTSRPVPKLKSSRSTSSLDHHTEWQPALC